MIKKAVSSTMSIAEIHKFEQMAEDWWNPLGKFKPLHQLTPLRLKYIIDITKKYCYVSSLENLKILDIGCGGGLVTEPLARLNSEIIGIDASSKNIKIAKDHAKLSKLNINYQSCTAEELLKSSKQKFQLIIALEIIEHVENIDFFIETCCKLLQPGGVLIFSTMNKTIKSYLESIIVAEYILKWLPIGTHDWKKFIKPSEIVQQTNKHGMKLVDLNGIAYSILSQSWCLSNNIDNNYFISFSKSI